MKDLLKLQIHALVFLSHGCKCSEAGLGKEVKQMHSESDDLKLAHIGLNTRI